MSRLLIRGGNRLQGEVTIQGAKNSVLPILAATILTGGSVELRRCPRLRDVETSIRILQALGCKAGWRGDVLEVDTAGMTGCDVPDALMREMRSSVIFLGAILARCGEASLTSPGGCELGPRPIDLHLSGLRALGAEIDDTGGTLHCKAAKLTGREIVLGFPSVGATENLMLAACGAEGVTVLSNAAREPEIEDLQGFLNTCGAEITGAGTSTVVIRGGRPLHGGTYTILPDRIAGGGVRRDRRQRRDRVSPYRTIDGAPAHPHGPLSRLSHRRAGHFDGGAAAVPGGGGIRGKPVQQPLPPCG